MHQAEQEVARLCAAGLSLDAVRTRVLRALNRVMPVDTAFVATADPRTLLFSGVAVDEPLAAVAQQFLDNEFGRADVNHFAALAAGPRHVGSLDHATGLERSASPRCREIMRPLGLGDELRAALVVGGECWGYLCLHREDHRLGFTEDEAELVAKIGPRLAHALRQSVLLTTAAAPVPAGPGVVLLAEDLTLLAATPQAERFLDQFGGAGMVPLPLRGVASALRASPAGVVPSVRVRTRTGAWLAVHASRLGGTGQIAVVLEPVEADTPLILAAYGLTAREAEIAVHVLRGLSTRAISEALHISQYTVQDHLKAVFDKTGVRNRRALVSRLMGTSRG